MEAMNRPLLQFLDSALALDGLEFRQSYLRPLTLGANSRSAVVELVQLQMVWLQLVAIMKLVVLREGVMSVG